MRRAWSVVWLACIALCFATSCGRLGSRTQVWVYAKDDRLYVSFEPLTDWAHLGPDGWVWGTSSARTFGERNGSWAAMEWRNGIPRVAQVVTRTAGDAAQVEDPTVAWPERLPDLVVGYVDDRWQQVGEWTVFERATRTLWRCDFGDGTVSDHSTIAAWYEDGTPKLRGEEWGMELGGVWREWHRNGQLALEGPAPNGPFRRYDASGALIESSTKPPTIDVPFGRYWLANESRRVLLR